MTIEGIRKTSTEKLKNLVKKKINQELDNEIRKLAKEKTKYRFCTQRGKKEYLEKVGFTEARLMMKVRLNMIEVRSNYKNQYQDLRCSLCKVETDSTEHIFECKSIAMNGEYSMAKEIIYSEEGKVTRESIQYLKKVMELKGIDIFKKAKEIFKDEEGI